jgi:hypothetical protein
MHLLQRHPKNHVFGLVDRPEAIKSILQELEQRGIAEEDVQVVSRQEDTQTTEPDESGSRSLEVVARAAEKLSEEHEFSELYESKVEAGEYLVGIPTSDLIDKEAAHDILHDHGAHSINYYGQWVVEELET